MRGVAVSARAAGINIVPCVSRAVDQCVARYRAVGVTGCGRIEHGQHGGCALRRGAQIYRLTVVIASERDGRFIFGHGRIVDGGHGVGFYVACNIVVDNAHVTVLLFAVRLQHEIARRQEHNGIQFGVEQRRLHGH